MDKTHTNTIKREALFLLEACGRNECTGVKFLRYSLKGA
jgi:hypothetical protein